MTNHMNRMLAEQYVTELRHAAQRHQLAREASSNGRRPGLGARLVSVLRGNAVQRARHAGDPHVPDAREGVGIC